MANPVAAEAVVVLRLVVGQSSNVLLEWSTGKTEVVEPKVVNLQPVRSH